MKIKFSKAHWPFLKMGTYINMGNGIKYYHFPFWIKVNDRDINDYEIFDFEKLPNEVKQKLFEQRDIVKTIKT